MKRRDFIKRSGAVITTASIFGSVAANSFISNRNIKIGIIGTGSRGNGLISLLNEIEGVEVVACCDILSFQLKNGLKRAGMQAKSYSDYKSLLEDKNIDAVLIATPFATHGKIVINALKANKHVYCEKTMTRGYLEIKNMVDAVQSSGKIVQVGHQYHSSYLYKEVVKMINKGKIGKISTIECQWNRNGNWRRPVPDPAFERAINWRMYKEFSGGLTAELCSHQIDFVNWVTNSNPEKVIGMGGIDYWKDGRETYDNIHLLYEYPNGIKATFMCLTSNSKDDYQIKVLGDKGTIILDYTKAWFYPEGEYNDKKILGDVDGVSGATIINGWEEGKGIPISIDHDDPTRQALIDFRDSILTNRQPISNVVTGAKTAIAVQMGIDAMYGEKPVYWKNVSLI